MSRECEKHGNYAPSRFCCACTREPLEAEVERLRAFVRDVAEEPFYGGTPSCSERARELVGGASWQLTPSGVRAVTPLGPRP